MTVPRVEGAGCFYKKERVYLMITDNFQKSSHFFDQQQVAPWWLSEIGSASVRRKRCVIILRKKAQEQIRWKFIVELLVLWQRGILISITEIKLIFYPCKLSCFSLGVRPPGSLFFSLQGLYCPRPVPSPFPKWLYSCLSVSEPKCPPETTIICSDFLSLQPKLCSIFSFHNQITMKDIILLQMTEKKTSGMVKGGGITWIEVSGMLI